MGKLIIVPTPIGNLEDITLRALRVLKEVVLVLAEDTRTSKKLLSHYSISTPLRAYHMHNEHLVAPKLAAEIRQADGAYALVSDAGTPGISDPAYLLVRACLDMEVEVECLPGATAFVPALVKSGMPTNAFIFEGFLPQKKGRMKKLQSLVEEERTIIFYESPHRLLKFLEQVEEVMGPDKELSISRELTKKFEQTLNGTVAELKKHFEAHEPKGEFVIVLHGKV